MPDGMGRMIQMISALAQIQNQRRALDLQEQQHEEGKRQFGLQLGFNEKSQEYKKISDIVDLIARSSSEARGAATDLASTLFPNRPDLQAAFSKLAVTAPETVETIRNVAADRGFRQPGTATPQELEAASQATTGRGTGEVAQSGLQALLAAAARPAVNAEMGRGYAEHLATGRTPLAALVEARVAQDPSMLNRLAGVTSGIQMRESDVGQIGAAMAGVNQRSIEAESNFVEHMLAASARGQMTPGDLIQGYSHLSDIANDIATKKGGKDFGLTKLALFNRLAQLIDPTLMVSDPDRVPDGASIMGRAQRALGGGPPAGYPTPPVVPPGAGVAPPTRPFMNTPQPQMFGPIPNYNPLQQFIRP